MSFAFTLVSEKDFLKYLSSLRTKNSAGFDGITVKLLKMLSWALIYPLTLIITQSLVTGIFPKKLKIAKVLPLFKKDDYTLMDNYRLISLLTSISKLFEKVVFTQLYDYFRNNDLFYDSQFGFLKDHSTEYAAMELYSENARVCAKWQWNARDCVTGLHDRRSRECNPVTPVECVSLPFRTHSCVLAFIAYIMCTNGIEMVLV